MVQDPNVGSRRAEKGNLAAFWISRIVVLENHFFIFWQLWPTSGAVVSFHSLYTSPLYFIQVIVSSCLLGWFILWYVPLFYCC